MGQFDKATSILDIGTGYGFMLQFLAEHFSSVLLLSIDVSYTNLKAVRGRLRIFGINYNVHLVVADALNSPFGNDQFDAVESWAGQGNIVRFCNVFRQAHRMLKDNGWFVTDVGGRFERADRDTRTLIESVGLEFFERTLRKLGLLPAKEEAIDAMKKYGFHDVSSERVDSMSIVSGRK